MHAQLSLPPRDDRVHVLEVIGNAIVGGMERWVERLIERLPPERFVVSALVPCEGPFAERLRALGTNVVATPMPSDPSWDSIQLAASLVRHAGVHLLHAHLPNAHVLAALAGRLAGRPVLATVHGRQLTLADLELHRSAGSHLSAVCRQTYFHALGLGVQPSLLSFDPNGVDCAVFQPRSRTQRSGLLRTRLGLAPDVPLLGFAGRLSPEKGPEVFVRSIWPLLARLKQAHAVIAGDGPMRAGLEREIGQLRLHKRVHFVGLVEDMAGFYGEIDLLANTSHSEAMPLNVMEAMASGVPVVATRVGGVPDIVAHGYDGWLVAPGDCDDIGGRCAGLLADAALRAQFGAHARQRVLKHFNLDRCTAQVQQLLVRLAGSETSMAVTPLRRPVAADFVA
ncbi:glycosyltransferase family 4 protein [Paucibacter sp. R3-3]|uniref:Glycosyltransferase family 4 protein n=1 Tax=Roseateles agri TaxID=3098619 RepID=A0ABU5DML3_9BURK|nr:glycosyltransferase family 4 protein [Paucibacter sp. R3-3]MDY0747545.1 glycosyltransferase family 4 protein [Paucibacter sp. R3-3]